MQAFQPVSSQNTRALSVVMPAYNEAGRIENNLLATVATLTRTGIDYEIIVVDDGSLDGTYAEALKARQRHPHHIRVVRCDVNRGKGNALVCGTAHAAGTYVAFLDADLDLHPSHVSTLLETLRDSGADIIIGSKLHPMSQVNNYPFLRKLYSRAYYGLTHVLFRLPVKDTQTGIKVFKLAALERIFPLVTVRRFAFDLEVLALAQLLGFRILAAPVRLDFQRIAGRIALADAFAMAIDTLRIYFRLRSLAFATSSANAARRLPAFASAFELEA